MKLFGPQQLIAILLFMTLAVGCTTPAAPAPTATSIPPADVPTEVPPTAMPATTAVPPTQTSTVTATPLPPTRTPTSNPTQLPSATPSRTLALKPTKTRSPQLTAKPAATKAPAAAPSGSGGAASVTVKNTFPLSCLLVFWGPADLKLDASANGTASGPIKPGIYGWRAFIGGAQTGEAGNLEIPAGSTCIFVCDKDALAIRYGCH